MKIISMTKIKNEADIVESFVRYHENIFDEMYFIDNGSCDGTVEILKSLKAEGIPVYIYDEGCSEMTELRFANEYLYKIFDATKCDWIIPIDADEYFCARSGMNPKGVLAELSQDEIVSIKWRTYICVSEKDKNLFLPQQYKIFRDEKDEEFDKLLMPKNILEKRNVLLREGYHTFQSTENINVNYNQELFFAHYPIRSIAQLKKQMLINGINLMHNGNAKKAAQHWKDMFLQIKAGKLDLQEYSQKYALFNDNKSGMVFEGMIETGFCKNTEIRYAQMVNMDVEECLIDLSERLAIKKRIYELLLMNEKRIVPRTRIVIWGTGRDCQRDLSYIDTSKYEIVAFIDSNIGKAYSTYEGKLVLPPEKAKVLKWDYIVIAAEKYYEEIRECAKQLCDVSKIKKICEILIDGYIV